MSTVGRRRSLLASIILTAVITGGLLAPTLDGLMKIARDESFSLYVHHEASNQTLSVPPEFRNQTIWGQNVPQGLKEECNKVVRNSLGQKAEGLEIEIYRLCWLLKCVTCGRFAEQGRLPEAWRHLYSRCSLQLVVIN